MGQLVVGEETPLTDSNALGRAQLEQTTSQGIGTECQECTQKQKYLDHRIH